MVLKARKAVPLFELEVRQRLINRLFWQSVDRRLSQVQRDETKRVLHNRMLVHERQCRKFPFER